MRTAKIRRQWKSTLRVCLHGGGGPQIGEVTCGGSPHLSCKSDQIKMRDYMDRRLTPPSGLPHLPGVPHLHVNTPLVLNILDLKQPQRWRQQQEEKRNNFARESHIFVHDFAVAVRLRCRRNFLISRFIAFANPTFFTAFPNRRQSPLNFNSRNFPQHLTIE